MFHGRFFKMKSHLCPPGCRFRLWQNNFPVGSEPDTCKLANSKKEESVNPKTEPFALPLLVCSFTGLSICEFVGLLVHWFGERANRSGDRFALLLFHRFVSSPVRQFTGSLRTSKLIDHHDLPENGPTSLSVLFWRKEKARVLREMGPILRTINSYFGREGSNFFISTSRNASRSIFISSDHIRHDDNSVNSPCFFKMSYWNSDYETPQKIIFYK